MTPRQQIVYNLLGSPQLLASRLYSHFALEGIEYADHVVHACLRTGTVNSCSAMQEFPITLI
ncbi:MAG: hypothetical protein HOL98_07725 [Gammaproteobacteria bacterium]|jgi:hypothetical protein|nr:hypothetical protein [Gammaproteobacteria bacterium]